MAATMKDIARRTGLGLATISSYFNGGNVREKNRIKIEEAIQELHYEVNEVARGLKTNATKTIGVVIPELNPVNYTSLDGSILSVDESGHVTALHTGTGMVRALLNTGDYALIAVEVTCAHAHTTRTETPATCTEDGSVTVICDDCDEVLSTETLPATGHSTVVKNAKDATCTEPGYTGDKVCTVCSETVETGETGEVIPAAGHSYKDGKCTVCGAADPNANSGGNTGNNGTDSPNTADGAAMGLWLSLMTVAALAGAVLVAGKTPDSPLSQRSS